MRENQSLFSSLSDQLGPSQQLEDRAALGALQEKLREQDSDPASSASTLELIRASQLTLLSLLAVTESTPELQGQVSESLAELNALNPERGLHAAMATAELLKLDILQRELSSDSQTAARSAQKHQEILRVCGAFSKSRGFETQ